MQGDCLERMKEIGDGTIDLTVTSPPYDNLRTYNGNNKQWGEHVWKTVIKELYRVTKKGGVVVWVVGDATIKGTETGTSFKQALAFKEMGFNLHDTMIYQKGGQGATGSNLCYWQDFEYMFVLSKGKPSTLNFLCDRKNVVKPRIKLESQGHRYKTGAVKGKRIIERKKFGKRTNIWLYHESGTRTSHPAVFPEKLAHDHIISWSNEGDTVFDPFMGSGTTGKMAKQLNRNFIGIEIDETYFKIAQERISAV
jgi:site-specific DNA-methyltransferase (adenine-specific)